MVLLSSCFGELAGAACFETFPGGEGGGAREPQIEDAPLKTPHTRGEGHHKAYTMALLSGLFHESEAKTRASEERRYEKYGGEQKIDSMIDLSEETMPGVLMKKIVRPGNGELPPVGSNVSR